VFFASNLRVDMDETIVQSMKFKHFWISNILGGVFASPS